MSPVNCAQRAPFSCQAIAPGPSVPVLMIRAGFTTSGWWCTRREGTSCPPAEGTALFVSIAELVTPACNNPSPHDRSDPRLLPNTPASLSCSLDVWARPYLMANRFSRDQDLGLAATCSDAQPTSP